MPLLPPHAHPAAAAGLKTPLKSRTQSPSHHFLSPNNDDFEKAQARAARAAAQRRKSFVLDAHGAGLSRLTSFGNDDVLSKDQILDLFQNCIKLATENKINQRNTWELRLIDHISEIVRADEGDDAETNFQKASCTLEAGIKIYSYRVDSVHSETFKVLGGLNRTAADERENSDADTHDGSEEDNGNQKKDTHKKLSTSSSTLESYDALNVKKFDVAFSIDPLFNQTSAQFDEGGAKGLLLNTLSVYNGCTLVFDSNDIPTKNMKPGAHFENPSDLSIIDLSCMKDCFQKLKADMHMETEISPTLRDIVSMLDDPYRAEAASKETIQADNISGSNAANLMDPCEEDLGEVVNEGGSADFDENHEQGNDDSIAGLSPDCAAWESDPTGQEDKEGNFDANNMDSDVVGSTLLVNWMSVVLDLPSKSNAWTGPDHWKYKKAQEGCKSSEPSGKIHERRNPKSEKFSVDFLHPSKIDMSAFAPVPDPRALIMPQSNTTVSTLLPEDCHYQAEDLVRLYLQPLVMCINQTGKKKTEATRTRSSGFEMGDMPWGNTYTPVSEGWDDDNFHSDMEDPENEEMVPKPRKVQKIEVNYDKTSKQIDVRVLKETLWESMQEMSYSNQELDESRISFRSLLKQFPTNTRADTPGDISVHLCFICLLHLANEHSLRIDDCRSLNELHIYNVNAADITNA